MEKNGNHMMDFSRKVLKNKCAISKDGKHGLILDGVPSSASFVTNVTNNSTR